MKKLNPAKNIIDPIHAMMLNSANGLNVNIKNARVEPYSQFDQT